MRAAVTDVLSQTAPSSIAGSGGNNDRAYIYVLDPVTVCRWCYFRPGVIHAVITSQATMSDSGRRTIEQRQRWGLMVWLAHLRSDGFTLSLHNAACSVLSKHVINPRRKHHYSWTRCVLPAGRWSQMHIMYFHWRTTNEDEQRHLKSRTHQTLHKKAVAF